MTTPLPLTAAIPDQAMFAPSPARSRATLELRFPSRIEAPWLNEVRQLRGRIIYDGGRRPSFLTARGEFDDPDHHDFRAYHIVARSGGKAVGCARIMPLGDSRAGAVAATVGAGRIERLIRDLGVKSHLVAEASRWMVSPEYRGELGRTLVAATWAVARWLGIEISFVLAGTRERQDIALLRMGARAVEGVSLIPCKMFDDDLHLLYFPVSSPTPSMLSHIDEAATALNLPGRNTGAI